MCGFSWIKIFMSCKPICESFILRKKLAIQYDVIGPHGEMTSLCSHCSGTQFQSTSVRGHYYLLQSGDDHSRGPLKKKVKTASGGGSKLKKK